MLKTIINGINHLMPYLRIVWASQVALNIALAVVAIILHQNSNLTHAPWIMGTIATAMAIGNIGTLVASFIFKNSIATI